MTLHDTNLPKNTWDKFQDIKGQIETQGTDHEKLANIIQSQADKTQFIVVSHRKPMIESAHRTIGVTQKEKGISKVTGVKLRDLEELMV